MIVDINPDPDPNPNRITTTTAATLTVDTSQNHNQNLLLCPSPSPTRRKIQGRWHTRCHTGTALIAVVALLFSTTAWLCLIFSGSTTSRCWHLYFRHLHFRHSEVSPAPLHYISPSNSLPQQSNDDQELSLNHILFGIAGSSRLWNRRKEFVRLWWRPNHMRGHVWLEDTRYIATHDSQLPPIMISSDISSFRYTNPTGHPSGLRISRIVSEAFRLALPNVRWFVLGDDDTIFNPDNLVDVLSKYDSSEMVYIGTPSESHSANTYFSHSMAFGGGGIAISYPLAQAVSSIQDHCLERYPKLYGSDDRLHACISEIGVPLTREHGFHQWDIRGNAHGLLSAHPIAPFVSIHHVEAVDPFFPVQVYPNIVLPRELERSEQTYSAWNKRTNRNEFDFDTRDAHKSACKKPVIFYLKDAWKEGNSTMGTYSRGKESNELKRKVFCFPRSPPLLHVQNIRVMGYPLRKNWHLVPRRLCCKLKPTNDGIFTIMVQQCERGTSNSVFDSL